MAKEKLTVWADQRVVAALKQLAVQRGVSLSETTAEVLRCAVDDAAEEIGADLLGPRLEAAIRREVTRMADRLAYLGSVAAIESSTARRMAMDQLVRNRGLEEGKRVSSEARKAAVRALREKPDTLLQDVLNRAAKPAKNAQR